jgi:hypothetical protein
LACQDEFFVNNPLDVKENYKHALDFALHLFAFLVCPKPSMPFQHQCMAHASFPEHLLIIARASITPFPRNAQNLMHTHCWFYREIASGQIQDSK